MRLNRFLATKKGLLIVLLIALLILAIVILAVPYVSAG
jgi:hypothetical protein